MKNTTKITAVLLGVIMLTGCTFNINVPSNTLDIASVDELKPTVQSGTDSTAEENLDVVLNENPGKIEGVSFEILMDYDNGTNCGCVKWTLDGSPKEFQSPYDGLTELQNVQDIGLVGETKYYFISHGVLYIVDLLTCEAKEAGEEIGASCSWDFDDNNNIYICGYYGPNLVVISSEGEEIAHIDNFNTGNYVSLNYYWPYELEFSEGYVYITYESVEGKLKVNPSDGTAEMEDVSSFFVSIFSGEWTMDYFDIELDRFYAGEDYECTVVFDENMNMSLTMEQYGEVTHKFDNMPYEFKYVQRLEEDEVEKNPVKLTYKPDDKNEIIVFFNADLCSIEISWREVLSEDYTMVKILHMTNREWVQYNRDKLAQ